MGGVGLMIGVEIESGVGAGVEGTEEVDASADYIG